MDLDSWGVLLVAAIAHDVAYGDLKYFFVKKLCTPV